ncbi:MAG: hypothetical protein JW829_12860 [Pirellulales bacterium]|nr:hypothetical protein [Pirellulales bacterium]
MPGPRGLIRIYAPYLGQPTGRMINFIAVEPIISGQENRGFSELESSQLDGVRGKRFWSVDVLDDLSPRSPERPARGIVSQNGPVEILELFLLIERFQSGAHPYIKIHFQSDRPHEVRLTAFAHDDSKPMDSCVLTATMGNYARLRRLHLADRIVLSTDLWPQFHGYGFAPPIDFPLNRLVRTPEGDAYVAATTNEDDPENASYAMRTAKGWKYQGKRAIQYWRCENPPDNLRVRVNGRAFYWASRRPIPGGISFENFEMIAEFRDHAQFWFGVQ